MVYISIGSDLAIMCLSKVATAKEHFNFVYGCIMQLKYIEVKKTQKPYVLSVETCVSRCRCGFLFVFENEFAMGVLVFENEFAKFLALASSRLCKVSSGTCLGKVGYKGVLKLVTACPFLAGRNCLGVSRRVSSSSVV